jgi:diguanylate cyclase (GGDEF)-like protein
MRCLLAALVAAGSRTWGMLLATMLWSACAHAQPGAWPPTTLGDGTTTLNAQALARVWEDPQGTATIEQVSRAAGRFQPGEADAIYPFGPGGALWLHYRLVREPNSRHAWLLAFPSPVLDYVSVWQQDAKGVWRSQTGGDTVAMDSWPEAGRYPYFRLDLPAGQVRDVFVQIRSVTPTSIPVRLASESAHDQHIQLEYLGLGAAFGSLLLLIAACVVQAWVYRDAVYGWYAAYAFVTALCVVAYTGVAAHLLWTGSGFWADTSQGTLASLAAGAAMMFVRNLTGISARHRVLDRLAWAGGPAGLLLALAFPLIHRPAGLAIMAAYVAFAALTNITIAWLSWRRGDAVGLWVLVAYLPLTAAVLLALIRIFGLLPVSFGTQYAIVAAMALEVPLLLVALSIRSRDRHGAQIRELALSSQDALTGLLAPHLFHDRLRQVVSRYKRDREDAAVVFIDLVNYPRIKAHYGSTVAEQSLLRSVIKLRRLLRDVDTVGRIGEARFGLILEGVNSRIAVTDRAARLIAAGLMPLKGLKPDVTLQFHVAGVLLAERMMEPPELVDALGALLGAMSSRTRRPIRFLEPEATQPQALEADSMRGALEEDSQPPETAVLAGG